MAQTYAIVTAMHLSLHHHPHVSVVAVEGNLDGHNVTDLTDLLSMVPLGQPLIVDLLSVGSLDEAAAAAMYDEFFDRTPHAEVAVVVDDLDVRMRLVLGDVDRCCRLVPGAAAASIAEGGV